MNAEQLFEAGQVTDAEKALSAFLRDHPSDTQQRTFLFELLGFSGQFDRAEKQLGVLAAAGGHAELGAVLYYSALHAERTRHELFGKQEFPASEGAPCGPGKLNGKAFERLEDCDSAIGARLEVFVAGAYLWLPFEHIASISIQPPRRLIDLLWMPGLVSMGSLFKGADIGEVLLPVIYPFSWKHADESVWLGRITTWVSDHDGIEYPLGQKMFLVDGEEIPLLEIRTLEFASAATLAER